MDETFKKIISSICYFSIFFAGFLFPLVVYLIVDDDKVKGHAKAAFWSHLIPLLTIPFIIIVSVAGPTNFLALFILLLLICGAINIAVIIWNIVKGIKVLQAE